MGTSSWRSKLHYRSAARWTLSPKILAFSAL
jgi:hypothetical protein